MGETRAPERAVLRPDSSCWRTVGGIFFYVVRGGVTVAEHRRIWPYPSKPSQPAGGSSAPAEPALPAFRWEDAGTTSAIIMQHSEEARTV